jgi:hypothetical protein
MKQGGFGIQSLVRFQELLPDLSKVGPKDFLVFLCTWMIVLCKSKAGCKDGCTQHQML